MTITSHGSTGRGCLARFRKTSAGSRSKPERWLAGAKSAAAKCCCGCACCTQPAALFTSVHVLSEPEHGSVASSTTARCSTDCEPPARFCRPCSITCFFARPQPAKPEDCTGSCGCRTQRCCACPAAAGPTSDCIPSTAGTGFDECRNHRWRGGEKAAQGHYEPRDIVVADPGAGTRAQYPPRAPTGGVHSGAGVSAEHSAARR